jgi:hypothetical protein
MNMRDIDKKPAVTVKLDFPIELSDGRKVTELNLRRPKVKDLLDYPMNEGAGLKEEVALVAHLCGDGKEPLVAEDLQDLDSSDYAKLQKAMLRFRDNTKN